MNPQTPQPMASAPSPQPVAPTPMSGGKKMNKGLLAGIIVAVVLLLAGGAWAVYALFFATTPEKLVSEALKNLSQTKTMAVDFEIGSEGAVLSGNIASTTDDTDRNGEVILTFGDGSQAIVLRAMALDGALFFKANNIEQAAPLIALYTGLPSFGSDEFVEALKTVNDKWFEVTKEQMASLEQSGTDVTTTISSEEVKKVVQIYDQHPFVKPDKIFADEAVNGVQSAHFSVKVDKQKQTEFFNALKAANLKGFQLTDEDLKKFREATDTQNGTIEVWIARDSKKFTKLHLTGTTEGAEIKVTLTASANLPTFDKLERPAGARPITELMTLLFSSAYSPDELESLSSGLMY